MTGVARRTMLAEGFGSMAAMAMVAKYPFSEYVTPQQFGAAGDGEADDTAAIQQALTAPATTFLPPGRYRVTGQVPGAALRLRGGLGKNVTGAGPDKVELFLGDHHGYPMVRPLVIDSCHNLHISGFTVKGEREQFLGLPEQMNNIFIRSSTNIILQDIKSCDANGDAINLGQSKKGGKCENININNCHFDRCARNGVTLGGYGFENITIEHCYFGAKIDTQQIDMEPLKAGVFAGIMIRDNHFETMAGDKDEYAITISGHRPARVQQVDVIGNWIGNGILIRGAEQVHIAANHAILSANFHNPPLQIDHEAFDIGISDNLLIRSQSSQPVIRLKQVGRALPKRINITNNHIIARTSVIELNRPLELTLDDNQIEIESASGSVLTMRQQPHNSESSINIHNNRITGGSHLLAGMQVAHLPEFIDSRQNEFEPARHFQ